MVSCRLMSEGMEAQTGIIISIKPLPTQTRGVCPVVGVVCLLRRSVGLEYGLVSLELHCFLRLARALCWRSGRCLVGDAFSVLHGIQESTTKR